MALTASRELDRYIDQELRALPVLRAKIFKGAFVGLHNGMARPLERGDLFAGIAYEEVDNLNGDDGSKCVRVYTKGDFEHELVGASHLKNGCKIRAFNDCTIYDSDDTGFRTHSYVGRQVMLVAINTIILRIKSVFDR